MFYRKPSLLQKAKLQQKAEIDKINNQKVARKVDVYTNSVIDDYVINAGTHKGYTPKGITSTLKSINKPKVDKEYEKAIKNPKTSNSLYHQVKIQKLANEKTIQITEAQYDRLQKNINAVDRVLRNYEMDIDKYKKISKERPKTESRRGIISESVMNTNYITGLGYNIRPHVHGYKDLTPLTEGMHRKVQYEAQRENAISENDEALSKGEEPPNQWKTWVWTGRGETTRHESNDGQTVKFDEKFTIVNDADGQVDMMMYPLDPDVTSSNGWLCYCEVEYHNNPPESSNFFDFRNADLDILSAINNLSKMQLPHHEGERSYDVAHDNWEDLRLKVELSDEIPPEHKKLATRLIYDYANSYHEKRETLEGYWELHPEHKGTPNKTNFEVVSTYEAIFEFLKTHKLEVTNEAKIELSENLSVANTVNLIKRQIENYELYLEEPVPHEVENVPEVVAEASAELKEEQTKQLMEEAIEEQKTNAEKYQEYINELLAKEDKPLDKKVKQLFEEAVKLEEMTKNGEGDYVEIYQNISYLSEKVLEITNQVEHEINTDVSQYLKDYDGKSILWHLESPTQILKFACYNLKNKYDLPTNYQTLADTLIQKLKENKKKIDELDKIVAEEQQKIAQQTLYKDMLDETNQKLVEAFELSLTNPENEEIIYLKVMEAVKDSIDWYNASLGNFEMANYFKYTAESNLDLIMNAKEGKWHNNDIENNLKNTLSYFKDFTAGDKKIDKDMKDFVEEKLKEIQIKKLEDIVAEYEEDIVLDGFNLEAPSDLQYLTNEKVKELDQVIDAVHSEFKEILTDFFDTSTIKAESNYISYEDIVTDVSSMNFIPEAKKSEAAEILYEYAKMTELPYLPQQAAYEVLKKNFEHSEGGVEENIQSGIKDLKTLNDFQNMNETQLEEFNSKYEAAVQDAHNKGIWSYEYEGGSMYGLNNKVKNNYEIPTEHQDIVVKLVYEYYQMTHKDVEVVPFYNLIKEHTKYVNPLGKDYKKVKTFNDMVKLTEAEKSEIQQAVDNEAFKYLSSNKDLHTFEYADGKQALKNEIMSIPAIPFSEKKFAIDLIWEYMTHNHMKEIDVAPFYEIFNEATKMQENYNPNEPLYHEETIEEIAPEPEPPKELSVEEILDLMGEKPLEEYAEEISNDVLEEDWEEIQNPMEDKFEEAKESIADGYLTYDESYIYEYDYDPESLKDFIDTNGNIPEHHKDFLYELSLLWADNIGEVYPEIFYELLKEQTDVFENFDKLINEGKEKFAPKPETALTEFDVVEEIGKLTEEPLFADTVTVAFDPENPINTLSDFKGLSQETIDKIQKAQAEAEADLGYHAKSYEQNKYDSELVKHLIEGVEGIPEEHKDFLYDVMEAYYDATHQDVKIEVFYDVIRSMTNIFEVHEEALLSDKNIEFNKLKEQNEILTEALEEAMSYNYEDAIGVIEELNKIVFENENLKIEDLNFFELSEYSEILRKFHEQIEEEVMEYWDFLLDENLDQKMMVEETIENIDKLITDIEANKSDQLETLKEELTPKTKPKSDNLDTIVKIEELVSDFTENLKISNMQNDPELKECLKGITCISKKFEKIKNEISDNINPTELSIPELEKVINEVQLTEWAYKDLVKHLDKIPEFTHEQDLFVADVYKDLKLKKQELEEALEFKKEYGDTIPEPAPEKKEYVGLEEHHELIQKYKDKLENFKDEKLNEDYKQQMENDGFNPNQSIMNSFSTLQSEFYNETIKHYNFNEKGVKEINKLIEEFIDTYSELKEFIDPEEVMFFENVEKNMKEQQTNLNYIFSELNGEITTISEYLYSKVQESIFNYTEIGGTPGQVNKPVNEYIDFLNDIIKPNEHLLTNEEKLDLNHSIENIIKSLTENNIPENPFSDAPPYTTQLKEHKFKVEEVKAAEIKEEVPDWEAISEVFEPHEDVIHELTEKFEELKEFAENPDSSPDSIVLKMGLFASEINKALKKNPDFNNESLKPLQKMVAETKEFEKYLDDTAIHKTEYSLAKEWLGQAEFAVETLSENPVKNLAYYTEQVEMAIMENDWSKVQTKLVILDGYNKKVLEPLKEVDALTHEQKVEINKKISELQESLEYVTGHEDVNYGKDKSTELEEYKFKVKESGETKSSPEDYIGFEDKTSELKPIEEKLEILEERVKNLDDWLENAPELVTYDDVSSLISEYHHIMQDIKLLADEAVYMDTKSSKLYGELMLSIKEGLNHIKTNYDAALYDSANDKYFHEKGDLDNYIKDINQWEYYHAELSEGISEVFVKFLEQNEYAFIVNGDGSFTGFMWVEANIHKFIEELVKPNEEFITNEEKLKMADAIDEFIDTVKESDANVDEGSLELLAENKKLLNLEGMPQHSLSELYTDHELMVEDLKKSWKKIKDFMKDTEEPTEIEANKVLDDFDNFLTAFKSLTNNEVDYSKKTISELSHIIKNFKTIKEKVYDKDWIDVATDSGINALTHEHIMKDIEYLEHKFDTLSENPVKNLEYYIEEVYNALSTNNAQLVTYKFEPVIEYGETVLKIPKVDTEFDAITHEQKIEINEKISKLQHTIETEYLQGGSLKVKDILPPNTISKLESFKFEIDPNVTAPADAVTEENYLTGQNLQDLKDAVQMIEDLIKVQDDYPVTKYYIEQFNEFVEEANAHELSQNDKFKIINAVMTVDVSITNSSYSEGMKNILKSQLKKSEDYVTSYVEGNEGGEGEINLLDAPVTVIHDIKKMLDDIYDMIEEDKAEAAETHFEEITEKMEEIKYALEEAVDVKYNYDAKKYWEELYKDFDDVNDEYLINYEESESYWFDNSPAIESFEFDITELPNERSPAVQKFVDKHSKFIEEELVYIDTPLELGKKLKKMGKEYRQLFMNDKVSYEDQLTIINMGEKIRKAVFENLKNEIIFDFDGNQHDRIRVMLQEEIPEKRVIEAYQKRQSDGYEGAEETIHTESLHHIVQGEGTINHYLQFEPIEPPKEIMRKFYEFEPWTHEEMQSLTPNHIRYIIDQLERPAVCNSHYRPVGESKDTTNYLGLDLMYERYDCQQHGYNWTTGAYNDFNAFFENPMKFIGERGYQYVEEHEDTYGKDYGKDVVVNDLQSFQAIYKLMDIVDYELPNGFVLYRAGNHFHINENSADPNGDHAERGEVFEYDRFNSASLIETCGGFAHFDHNTGHMTNRLLTILAPPGTKAGYLDYRSRYEHEAELLTGPKMEYQTIVLDEATNTCLVRVVKVKYRENEQTLNEKEFDKIYEYLQEETDNQEDVQRYLEYLGYDNYY